MKKLKEVIAETADEDGVEIYEVDDVMEVSQLLPTIGQSLTIFSNPKKCASVLQPNRRAIHKLNSKVILLSAKSIPRKTLDKFSKIGLTECVVEPVPPKTLLYKVKLLLRSIVVAGEEDEEQNEEVKFAHSEDEGTDTKQKQRVEKGIISESDNHIDYNLRGKLGTELEIDADESEENRPGYKEGKIETEWEGKVHNTDLAFDEDKEKDKEMSEGSYLDSYLRSKKKDKNEVTLDFEEPTKERRSNEMEYDEYGNPSKKSSLTLETGEDKTGREKEDKDKAKADDKYYKGKLNSSMLDMNFDEDDKDLSKEEEELEERRKNKTELEFGLDLSAENDSELEESSQHTDDDDLYGKRNKSSETMLDLDDEEEKSIKTQAELKLDRERESESEDSEHTNEKRRAEHEGKNDIDLGFEEDEEDQKKNDNEIDNYIRGNVSKTVTVIEEEEIDARNSNDISADEDEESDHTHLDLEKGLDLENDDEDESDLYGTKLKLQTDKEREEGLDLEEDKDDQENSRAGINLKLENDSSTRDDKSISEDEDDFSSVKKEKDLDLAFDSEESEKEANKKSSTEKDFGRRNSSMDLDLEHEQDAKKYSAHTERIETNLDSRKGIKHQEYDWDINKKKDGTENYGQEKKNKSQLDITFKEKVDLGEQTIDYRKLHSEFEAITINRSSSGKKSEGPKYYSENADKEFLRGIYEDDYLDSLSEAEIVALKNKVDKEEETIYTPKSNGIEIAIKVLNLYSDKNLNKEDLFKFITDSIKNKYQGYSTFYSLNKANGKFEKIYQSKENVLEKITDKEETHKDEWDLMNLPKWENEKFNTEENLFFFPIYEGANKLGYITCYFENSPKEDISKSIEVIFETTRGIFLEESHKAGLTGEYNKPKAISSQNNNEEEGIIKSIFGKFFKKAS
ncbi:hypothetical protein M900_1165 [Bacteriovorax sp. Seq25_V]|nr:hypothetical protein M900_1165 [Bacteriovorax sp. Seq25_V]